MTTHQQSMCCTVEKLITSHLVKKKSWNKGDHNSTKKIKRKIKATVFFFVSFFGYLAATRQTLNHWKRSRLIQIMLITAKFLLKSRDQLEPWNEVGSWSLHCCTNIQMIIKELTKNYSWLKFNITRLSDKKISFILRNWSIALFLSKSCLHFWETKNALLSFRFKKFLIFTNS